ncbi:MAG: ATP-binding protein [Candidatus Krumholzibacteria bacterium]|nr:ATP-binding protein [Candidatus Krumholzibacteria bacterium]
MLTRVLKKPDQSILLLGPRGTGKSTWIQHHFSGAVLYDLLNTTEVLRLSREPALLFREVSDLPIGSWVVIDEIQKVPALLDEVHRLIESKGLRFVLSGSSARKLRRGGSNLLAGRALITHMFPFVSAELNPGYSVTDLITGGTLPMSVLGADPASYLTTYAETYFQEEIRAEALTRNIGNFARFLEVAARQNGQVTNVSSIARDSSVSRQTVQNYFTILDDTMLGYWIEPWRLKRRTKQVQQPKFYLFDPGVARALSGRIAYPPTQEECGPLLETFLFNEIRAYLSYCGLHYNIHFWRSYDGVEVDFICETSRGFVTAEFKASSRWKKQFNRGLHRIKSEFEGNDVRCYGVYMGEKTARWDDVEVLPVKDFLALLWGGEVL